MIDYTLPLDQLPDPLPIEPLRKPFDVMITPPGSKSITCRAYVLAALAKGESKIIRPLRADDTDHLLNALCTLGASARWEGEDVYIKGVAGRFPKGGNLYMGEGGTPTRFMIACACLAAEAVVIDASPRMRERPIAEGVDMLRQLGATIEYVEPEGRLPVRVVPSKILRGGELNVRETYSSQSVSGLLLIASHLPLGIDVRFREPPTSPAYLELTLGVLAEWGADYNVSRQPLRFSRIQSIAVKPNLLVAQEYWISRDASSAAYWAIASAIQPNAVVRLELDSDANQPDLLCIDALKDVGAGVCECGSEFTIEGPERLKPFQFDGEKSPDGALAMAVLASRCVGGARITGLRTLRVKETDRIAALANELRKVGCTVEMGEDWIEITPPKEGAHAVSDDHRKEDTDERGGASRSGSTSPMSRSAKPSAQRGSSDPASARVSTNPVIIETYNDHRMAMAFAILGLVRPRISIRNPKCVAKSYPTFWKDFAKLYQ